VQTGSLSILVDSGPDFRLQMLRERVKRVDAVLFTHAHKDHTAGLDDIRSFNFLQKSKIPIYGTQEVINQLQKEFEYIFTGSDYPGIPQLDVTVIDENAFNIKDLTITPLKVMHHNLPVLGFRFHDFTYITDANHIPESSIQKIKDSKVLVLNALQKEPHISHFNLKQAIQTAKALKAGKTFFTHISHKLGLHRQVSESLPADIELAYDGLQITL
jgi:phosphoribosyl 1,2-cyclic phosphate phosphodiesterase